MTTALDPRHGRIAVVTGGAGAIGTAITRALHGNGHRTVVLDRDGDIACDLGSEASTRAAAAAVLERYGRCDVFVHCAAAFRPGDPRRRRRRDLAPRPGRQRRIGIVAPPGVHPRHGGTALWPHRV